MDVDRLVFIDETGLNTKMARLYGRALKTQRCIDHIPYGHWKSKTFVAALRHHAITAPMLFDGPMNGDTFLAYIREGLLPTLHPGDIVICDNLPAHKVKGVTEVIEQSGATLRYLPPYSPDQNPIEMAFSKLKAFIRQQAASTLEELLLATKQALLRFEPYHCTNFFKHANYATDYS